jgi:cell division protease FtsH
MTAYHEMGHALAGLLLENADPVHKVTIIPRGRALGLTWSMPKDELHSKSKEYFEDSLIMLMAGRAAEKIAFDNTSTGASNDLARATQLAKKMVCEWGMSDVIGPVTFNNDNDEVFLGRDFAHQKNYSEETAQIIDAEIRRILTTSYDKAVDMLTDNIEALHKTSKVLLEREVLDSEELSMLMRGEDLPPISKQAMNALRSMKIGDAESENGKPGNDK